MQFAANPETYLVLYGCESQSALRALRLFFLFTALASTPCLAEDANSAGTTLSFPAKSPSRPAPP
jgi:hypothetical protein